MVWHKLLMRKAREWERNLSRDLNKQLFGEGWEVTEMADEKAIPEHETEAFIEELPTRGGRAPKHRLRYKELTPEEIEERRVTRLNEGSKKLHIALKFIELIKAEGWALEDLQGVECIVSRALGL